MTATELFIRFLKDNGFYTFIKPFIGETYRKCFKLGYNTEETIGGSEDMVSAILRAKTASLKDIVFLIYNEGGYVNGVNKFGYRNYLKIDGKFQIFLKERVNKNYLKLFIRYNENELDFRKCRNGYHNLQFSIIKNPEEVKNVISYGRSNQHTYK